MAKNPGVGDQLINESGTVVEIAEDQQDGTVKTGTFPESRVKELLDAGYRPVKDDDAIPAQTHGK
ncbi:MAG: hypothetical protein ACR2OE_07490 [Thermomicrobiales bacterium]